MDEEKRKVEDCSMNAEAGRNEEKAKAAAPDEKKKDAAGIPESAEKNSEDDNVCREPEMVSKQETTFRKKMNNVLQMGEEYRNASADRTIAFFDAVMAIAITLLVLELPITDLNSGDPEKLSGLFIFFTSFLISFAVLGNVWLIHTMIYSIPVFRKYCSARRNLLITVPVILFPKVTELLADDRGHGISILLYLICTVILFGDMIYQAFSAAMRYMHRSTGLHTLVTNMLMGYSFRHDLYERLGSKRTEYLYQIVKINVLNAVFGLVLTLAEVVGFIFWPPVCYMFIIVNLILGGYAGSRSRNLYRKFRSQAGDSETGDA